MGSRGGRIADVVARRLGDVLAEVDVRCELGDALPPLLDALELFVPHVLREDHPEWEGESLDRFRIASAIKTADDAVHLTGLAILISDQAVTPFDVTMMRSADGCLGRVVIKLGEPGGGALGVSGPSCTSAAAALLLDDLDGRLPQVAWTYRATYDHADPALL